MPAKNPTNTARDNVYRTQMQHAECHDGPPMGPDSSSCQDVSEAARAAIKNNALQNI